VIVGNQHTNFLVRALAFRIFDERFMSCAMTDAVLIPRTEHEGFGLQGMKERAISMRSILNRKLEGNEPLSSLWKRISDIATLMNRSSKIRRQVRVPRKFVC